MDKREQEMTFCELINKTNILVVDLQKCRSAEAKDIIAASISDGKEINPELYRDALAMDISDPSLNEQLQDIIEGWDEA